METDCKPLVKQLNEMPTHAAPVMADRHVFSLAWLHIATAVSGRGPIMAGQTPSANGSEFLFWLGTLWLVMLQTTPINGYIYDLQSPYLTHSMPAMFDQFDTFFKVYTELSYPTPQTI